MGLRTLWNALRCPETRAALFSGSAAPALQTIYAGLAEQRRIIDHLKRYEDVTYAFVARRVASLRQEMAVIFHAPGNPAPDRRVQERRTVRRSVAVDRRNGIDRRMPQSGGP